MSPKISSSSTNERKEIKQLLNCLPEKIQARVEELIEKKELVEIVLDLGRNPSLRFQEGCEQKIREIIISEEDLIYINEKIGDFADDNRAGINGTLHRISAIRNRNGKIIGLTCRIGRAVDGSAEIIRDLITEGKSILLLGPPGVGKTTMLRECARILSTENKKRVVIVDTANEIGGDSDIPHPGIGDARRMQVAKTTLQYRTMIEAVENHMPEVIVVDEIGNDKEALAARTIAERGVQLVATAHGRTLKDLLNNPTLNNLLGGVATVTISDENAEKRHTQKTIQERSAPSTFDTVVEIRSYNDVVIYIEVEKVVDQLLLGQEIYPPPLNRTLDDKGVFIEETKISEISKKINSEAKEAMSEKVTKSDDLPRMLRVYIKGINSQHLRKAAQEIGVNIEIVEHLSKANLFMLTRHIANNSLDSIEQAKEESIKIAAVKSNSLTQIRDCVRELYKIKNKKNKKSSHVFA